MRSSAFSFALALLATAASAFAVVTTLSLSKDVRERPGTEGSLESRVTAVEQALAARDRASAAPAALSPSSSSSAAATSGAATGGPATLAGGGHATSPADLDRRLAAIEKKLHEREADGAAAAAPAQVVDRDLSGAVPAPTFLGSVDDAAKHLELTSAQRAEFERVIDDAKREVDTIRKTPDDTGATWEKVEKDVVRMENGAITFDGTKMAAFREKVMPGRSESFGGAMRRVRENAFSRLKSALSPAQQEKFGKTANDGLIPGAGGGDLVGLGSFSFVTTTDATPGMQ